MQPVRVQSRVAVRRRKDSLLRFLVVTRETLFYWNGRGIIFLVAVATTHTRALVVFLLT
jgi:hypothetical protein